MQIGYHLSSEEHDARALVQHAVDAEAAGFAHASISDHFHPWGREQGHSPFVWSTLGGIAARTRHLHLRTLVTCPILRVHPVIVAQAAATTATMVPGGFDLAVGTGERLNEHVLGQPWPRHAVRLRMLREAVEIMRELFEGELVSHDGEFFTVENAQLFDVPDDPVRIFVGGDGDAAVTAAAEVGDGLVTLAPDPDTVRTYRDAGGDGPVVSMQHVCIAPTEEEARKVIDTWWTTATVPHELNVELPLPAHFEAAAAAGRPEQVDDSIPLGPDPRSAHETIDAYREAGFDLLYLHQIGPDQQHLLEWSQTHGLVGAGQ